MGNYVPYKVQYAYLSRGPLIEMLWMIVLDRKGHDVLTRRDVLIDATTISLTVPVK